MAVHHQPHHLLDFTNMEAPPHAAAFDNDGILALQHVDPAAGGGGVLAAPPPWPQAAVSLSLFNYSTAAGASLQVGGGNHVHQPFTAVAPNHLHQVSFQLRSSRYLAPVQELLGEFCSLEGDLHATKRAAAAAGSLKWDDVESSSSGLSSLISTMDLMELQRRKARLLSMVEEVDQRYRRYREQMRSVEASFEAVAGGGASQVYTRLARRAMSRHFRCLRDALVAQVRALRKAMGESRDGGGAGWSSAPAGATKGDTPRLRVLDQCLRQQRVFQQPSAMDSYPWRPQRGLPERAVAVLRAWLFEHFLHPYPNDVDKHILARQAGLSRSQVSNWFINARVRLWKPMIEDMYKEEVNPSDAIVKAETATYKQQQLPSVGIGSSMMISSSPSSSSIVTDGAEHHLLHLHGGFPNLNNNAVSLTLGLQQQQQQQRLILETGREQLTGERLLLPPYV